MIDVVQTIYSSDNEPTFKSVEQVMLQLIGLYRVNTGLQFQYDSANNYFVSVKNTMMHINGIS